MSEVEDPGTESLPLDLPLPRVGNTIAGYRLEKELGRGGTAIVFRATRLRDGHICAFKMLQTRFWASGRLHRRLLRESRILGELSHPNVVRILDAGGPPQTPPFLVTELVAGPSLATIIKQNAPVPPQRAAEILLGIARGLGAAHNVGIVHRDLKPSNVILTHSGEREVVKLFDFGLATAHEEEVHGTRFTTAKDFLGTPAYMSPEQIRDPSQVGPAADLYALGMIAHELYLGHRPTNRPRKVAALLDADLSVPPLPGTGPLPRLIEGLLAVRPEDRPKDAAAVAARLEALVPVLPPEPDPELEPSVVSRVIQRLELPEPIWTRVSQLLIRHEGPAPASRMFLAFGLMGAFLFLGAALYLRSARPTPIAIDNQGPRGERTSPASVPDPTPEPVVSPSASPRPEVTPVTIPEPVAIPEAHPPPPRAPVKEPPSPKAAPPAIDPLPGALAARGLRKSDLPALGIPEELLERYEAGGGATEVLAALSRAKIGPAVVRGRLQVVLTRLERLAGSEDFDRLEARYFELRASLTADADEARCRQLMQDIERLDAELRDGGAK